MEPEAKNLKFTSHILKGDILNPNMSKKLARLEGRKPQGDSAVIQLKCCGQQNCQ